MREDAHVGVAVLDVREVARTECRLEHLFEELAIFLADAEYRHRADVTEDGITDILIELSEELMRDCQRELVLTSFRQDARNGIGRDVLELVNIEIERREVAARIVSARERSHEELADENEAEQVRIAFAEAAFGKIHEQNLLRVDDVAEIKG